jgi:hypothetical protein
MGSGRGARILGVGSDDVDVYRDRRLALLLNCSQPSKGEATTQESQVQSSVEGESAPEAIISGYRQRASLSEGPSH